MAISQVVVASTHITLVILFFLFSYNHEAYGQRLSINDVESISPCTSGLRHGIDFFVFRGYVNATSGKISNLVEFEIQTSPSHNFTWICTATLTYCTSPKTQVCYCAVENRGIYEILLNSSALVDYGNALIRIKWSGLSIDLFTNSLEVPTIYDVNNVTTSIILNDAPMTCPATVQQGSVIKFRCQKYPSPCVVAIAVDNTFQVKSENIAVYTVDSSLAPSSTHNFTFSYSFCGEAINSTTCQVTIAQARRDDVEVSIIAVIVGVCVGGVVLIIIVIIVVIIVRYKGLICCYGLIQRPK